MLIVRIPSQICARSVAPFGLQADDLEHFLSIPNYSFSGCTKYSFKHYLDFVSLNDRFDETVSYTLCIAR